MVFSLDPKSLEQRKKERRITLILTRMKGAGEGFDLMEWVKFTGDRCMRIQAEAIEPLLKAAEEGRLHEVTT